MNFIVTAIILSVLISFATIRAQNTNVDVVDRYHCNITSRVEDYVNLNRRQYATNLLNLNSQMETFQQSYSERLHAINEQKDSLIDSITQLNDYLNPFEVLSDYSNSCVAQYRSLVPSIAVTKTAMESCITTANNQMYSLIASPKVAVDNLELYYNQDFEKALTNCNVRFPNTTSLNNTICITQVVNTTNAYTVSTQNTFDARMDASRCGANSNVKTALNCSYAVLNSTISLMAEAKVSTDKCLQGVECSTVKRYSCSEGYYTPKSEIDFYNRTTVNPLYGRYNFNSDCLTIIYY